jgi:hypothetical protein
MIHMKLGALPPLSERMVPSSVESLFGSFAGTSSIVQQKSPNYTTEVGLEEISLACLIRIVGVRLRKSLCKMHKILFGQTEETLNAFS